MGGPSNFWLGQENLANGSVTVLGSLLNYTNCENGSIDAFGSSGNSLHPISSAVPTGPAGTCNNAAPAAGHQSLYSLNPSTRLKTYNGDRIDPWRHSGTSLLWRDSVPHRRQQSHEHIRFKRRYWGKHTRKGSDV